MSTTEIDTTARRKAAEIYRHFAAGQLSNDQMEKSWPESFERGLHDIFFCGIWPLYDDLYEHKLTGRYRLTPEDRDHVARIILFLHSTLPYRWPIRTGFRGIVGWLIAILTLGIYRPLRRAIAESGGDESFGHSLPVPSMSRHYSIRLFSVPRNALNHALQRTAPAVTLAAAPILSRSPSSVARSQRTAFAVAELGALGHSQRLP